MPLNSPRDFKDQVTRDAKVAGLFQYEVVQVLPTAIAELEYVILGVRKVPGTSEELLYICLGDAASTTAYSWQLIASGEFSLDKLSVDSTSSSTTLDATNSVVLVDASGGAITITLPTAVGITGKSYHIKKIDVSANNVTIDGSGSETIDGSTTLVISAQYDAPYIVSDGANWHVI